MGVEKSRRIGQAVERRAREERSPSPQPCDRCQTKYTPTRPWSRYCSEKCQREANRLVGEGGAPRTRAAISELRAAVDLLGRGFHVYKAFSPDSPALLVVKAGKALSVEVRTAYRSEAGSLVWNKSKDSDHDHVALVLPDQVIYQPPLS